MPQRYHRPPVSGGTRGSAANLRICSRRTPAAGDIILLEDVAGGLKPAFRWPKTFDGGSGRFTPPARNREEPMLDTLLQQGPVIFASGFALSAALLWLGGGLSRLCRSTPSRACDAASAIV